MLGSKRSFSSLFFAACLLAVVVCGNLRAQSTFGSFIGTIRDPSGAVVADCTITVTNTATGAQRTLTSDSNGSYVAPNLEPDTYELLMQKSGFEARRYTNIILTARQEIRIDGVLAVSAQTQTVTVNEASAPPINTEVSNIAETKLGRELNDLPVAISSRGTGSTSAFTTLTTQPGVEIDNSSQISIDGLKPSQLSVSIDGISTVSPRNTAAIPELFPAFDDIAEIRVSEINNTAEFGGVGDITTISKSGGNAYHGGLFENNQNTVYDARNTFSATVPKLDMNDFGGFLGGPVIVPHLYHGRNKTFFFGDLEFLRRPAQTVLVDSFPTAALRMGNLSAYPAGTILNPTTGVPFSGNQIPQSMIAPLATSMLNYLFPMPNTGTGLTNNYVTNFPAAINSDQGDLRVDQQITPNQTVYVRGTYKYKLTETAPTGTPFAGDNLTPEHDWAFIVAYNWIIRPTVFNEIRAGYTGSHTATTNSFPAATIASELGLQLPGPLPLGDASPRVTISGFTTASATASSISSGTTWQLLDNLTYNHGKHTYKFGGDYRYITAIYNNIFANYRMGYYTFNNSVSDILNSSGNPAKIGNAFAELLLGIPDSDQLGTHTDPNVNGHTEAYAGYAQDDFKVTSRLTINYGFRYEYHPMFVDKNGNVANFLPNYNSVQNGVFVPGAVVIPDGSQHLVNPAFAQSIAPMPIVTASQVGLPESLRYSQKTDFAPRIGFAWRVTGDGKTVIRGGFGKFIETELSNLLDAELGIEATDIGSFTNKVVSGAPLYKFPYPFPSNLAQPGTQYFDLSSTLHFQDPYVLQWNFTVERDLGFQTGLRVSYDGNHSGNLQLTNNPDQVPVNTVGYNNVVQYAPYPALLQIVQETNGNRQNYDALTVAVNKRLSRGLQFQVSYNFAKNLSDLGGTNPTSFVGALGNQSTDYYHPNLDYGNVEFTRRNRFLATFLYELPFNHTPYKALSAVTGGWELSGVILAQTGPFMTVLANGADPSGTNYPNLPNNGPGRADIVSGVSTIPANQSIYNWINTAAFAIPANNIGRFGDSPVGSVVGPGTQAVSLSLLRNFKIRERVNLRFGVAGTNMLNHPNYGTPGLTLGTSTFGIISSLQSAEGAGPRALQVSGRITF